MEDAVIPHRNQFCIVAAICFNRAQITPRSLVVAEDVELFDRWFLLTHGIKESGINLPSRRSSFLPLFNSLLYRIEPLTNRNFL